MKNKFIVSLFIYLFLVQSSFSQILEPASWEFKIDSSELTSSGYINLIFIPTTELGWYI